MSTYTFSTSLTIGWYLELLRSTYALFASKTSEIVWAFLVASSLCFGVASFSASLRSLWMLMDYDFISGGFGCSMGSVWMLMDVVLTFFGSSL